MANSLKGQVGFRVGESDFTLCYSINAIVRLEDETKLGMVQLGALLQDRENATMKLTRAAFWAGLTECHPDMSLDDAGRLMSEIGVSKALELLGQAMAAAFPASEGEESPPRKPRQSRGTGSA